MKKQFTRHFKLAVLESVTLGLVGFATLAKADWDPGDPHKMHYPQLPDPNGWDVAITNGEPAQLSVSVVADDWLCTETGPVSDIHIWFSMLGDQVPVLSTIVFTIWSDIPANPNQPDSYSRPGLPLWTGIFGPGGPSGYSVRLHGTGEQGWLDLNNGIVLEADHLQTYQLNLDINPDSAFVQQQGQIYWLGVHFEALWGPIGWKTSLDHFNDDAVWWDFHNDEWKELRDPLTGESLDMAFVITPEPSAAMMLAAALSAFALRRRRIR